MKSVVDILIPVRNEEKNVTPLVKRIDATLSTSKTPYSMIFIDDHSTDNTIKILKTLQKNYPIQVFTKVGKRGKAYSILEASKKSQAEHLVMIDADLQYPPEVIPEMISQLDKHGVVVARRQKKHTNFIRKFLSNSFRAVFGQFLLGLNCDVQSGLKAFRREVINAVDIDDVTAWTLDVPLLYSSLTLGYSIGQVDIEFALRKHGESKLQLINSIAEIGSQAIKHRFKPSRAISIQPDTELNMVGSGVIHKRRKFVTHTTLNPNSSALHTFTFSQKFAIFLMFLALVAGFLLNFLTTLKILVAGLSFIYFTDVVFNLFLILRSLQSPPEISPSAEDLAALKDSDLPMYSILCPLYKEANILPHFLDAIAKMDWPKNKLDVMLLLEEDDVETVKAAQNMDLPKYVRIIVVPDSQPKTKPKACNYGLNFAKGEYLVIYDAEDIPDPLQLKKVFVGFQQSPDEIRCIQAKLNYHNPHQNLLTRFFTAEYSLWFDVVLTGLQSINTTLPLGGTSNHFKTADLIALQGWDPFNVTEDCDLGIRLFKKGYKTAIVDSVTLEEANSSWKNWLRQRSRWIKGYMQTYLIHMRHPVQFTRDHGLHALIFQLTVGGKIAFMFINPFMWILTLSYFTLNAVVGPAIESLYPSVVFYMAITSLLLGNFLFIYYYMIGVAKREHWGVMKFVFLVPIYWLAVSVAACIALKQLITNPHYWEKTLHGLHLQKKSIDKVLEKNTADVLPVVTAETLQKRSYSPNISNLANRLTTRMKKQHLYIGGALLIAISMVNNLLNFGFNAYLGQKLPLTEFGILSLTTSFLYMANIPFGALSTTVNERIGFLSGRYGEDRSLAIWDYLKNYTRNWGIGLTVLWLCAIPLMMTFFHVTSWMPFVFFSPIWLFGIVTAVDRGFLAGELKFSWLAGVAFLETITKLLLAMFFVEIHTPHLIYLVIPFSIVVAFIPARAFVLGKAKKQEPTTINFKFPKKFFVISLLAGLSTMSFLSLDIVLVKHLLSPVEAGQYALISLVGKIIFFLSGLSMQFIIPLVSQAEGAKKSTHKMLWLSLLATAAFGGVGIIVFGFFGQFTLPLLLGDKILSVIDLLFWYCWGVLAFSLSRVFVNFYLAKKRYSFAVVSFLLTIVQFVGLEFFSSNLREAVFVMTMVGIINLAVLGLMHIINLQLLSIESNMAALIDLFSEKFANHKRTFGQLRILIFNWRDTKHVWSGGAETYIHEIAKQLVDQGHKVTVFCGNDGHAPRNEKIDGVQMVRRGGFYTVYIWAAVYYVMRFRGRFDVVIDSENGIPFFTPLYVRAPKFLLIHHIHQEVFLQHLKWPLSWVAMFIESVLMPFVYNSVQVLTVSESSKKAIRKIGLSAARDITVLNPGIDYKNLKTSRKTKFPSFVYIGRLKSYKNIDVALRAFSRVLADHPEAEFHIAGQGETLSDLKDLCKQLKITKSVTFHGKVTEEKKVKLLGQSWIAIQPSMIEGWGITVIEANACGTPVIASDVPGLRDSVVNKKTGLLVKALDVREFSQAMLTLIEDKNLRKELSKNAHTWSTQFRWETSVDLLLNTIAQETSNYDIVKKEELAYVKA